ncbi:MAG: glucosamine-6-phosphate deaminase [Magnetospirillum sp.]|nr:glucosamine-6-phosphate deaminase [Magnetospirillum sp.]
MLVLIEPHADAVSRRAADLVEGLIRAKPDCVIGLAAGATPLGLYAELVRRHLENALDFSRVTAIGLDDYLDLSPDHPAACGCILRRALISRVNLDPARIHLLDTNPQGDLQTYCAAHEARIEAVGGLDLQILGLGVNGHIGFNEPGCSLAARTHPVALRARTRITNGPLFVTGQEVPKMAMTMGVATILSARRIMLLATGPSKAEAVAKAVEGPVTAMLPASALQLHPDAMMLLDSAAAEGLSLKEDYRAEAAVLLERGTRHPAQA